MEQRAKPSTRVISWPGGSTRARFVSVKSDGYRTISSLNVTNGGLSVTAIFATPYAEWNLLFRDVEAQDGTYGCRSTTS